MANNRRRGIVGRYARESEYAAGFIDAPSLARTLFQAEWMPRAPHQRASRYKRQR